MRVFIIGLGIGLLGVLLWLVASVVAGFGEGLGAEPLPLLHGLMITGFIIMIGAPLTFWILLPLTRLVRRHR